MAASSAQTPTLRLPPMPKGYRAFKLWIAAALRRIGQLSGTSIEIDGADGASVGTDGTMRFKVGAGGAAANSHPFKVTHVSGNVFSVQAGTCLGKTITTQTIDVGSTRPVAILAYPQFTLSIYNSEFVYASSVKTGANAPVLTSSTSILSDVNSGITSAGNEARALIARIDTGNVISQITTGNIIGTFSNTGLNGTMGGSFNKNA